MKYLILFFSISLLSSCSVYQLKYATPQESSSYLNEQLENDKTKIVLYWQDQLKTFNAKEDPRHIYACSINGSRATVITPGTYAVIHLKDGDHQLSCKKASIIHTEENALWRYAKSTRQKNDVVNFSINNNQTLLAEIYHISPIILIRKVYSKDKSDLISLAPTAVTPATTSITSNHKAVALNIGQTIMPSSSGRTMQGADSPKANRMPASKDKPAKNNVAADCAKYVAAKKACSYIPFGSGICMSGVNSKFSRTVIEICSKL
jgi:hypothetical protein